MGPIPADPADLRFQVLGDLRVWRGGRELDIGGPKPRAVLAVLLLRRDQFVPSSLVIDEVWGENVPTRPVNLVQTYISDLRKRS